MKRCCACHDALGKDRIVMCFRCAQWFMEFANSQHRAPHDEDLPSWMQSGTRIASEQEIH